MRLSLINTNHTEMRKGLTLTFLPFSYCGAHSVKAAFKEINTIIICEYKMMSPRQNYKCNSISLPFSTWRNFSHYITMKEQLVRIEYERSRI
jgi:hypothetical protein